MVQNKRFIVVHDFLCFMSWYKYQEFKVCLLWKSKIVAFLSKLLGVAQLGPVYPKRHMHEYEQVVTFPVQKPPLRHGFSLHGLLSIFK
jgi:hypothetical protein